MARVLVAVSVVLLLVTGSVRDSYASEEWCEYDPLVLVTTPGGNIIPVYVLTGADAGPENLPLVTRQQHSRTAEPTEWGSGHPGQVEVWCPGGSAEGGSPPGPRRAQASTPRATILDTETGSGRKADVTDLQAEVCHEPRSGATDTLSLAAGLAFGSVATAGGGRWSSGCGYGGHLRELAGPGRATWPCSSSWWRRPS